MKPDQSLPGQPQPARVRPVALPIVLPLLALGLALSSAARAELSSEELAKLAQNPIANLISVSFQNNTNFNYGPRAGPKTS